MGEELKNVGQSKNDVSFGGGSGNSWKRES